MSVGVISTATCLLVHVSANYIGELHRAAIFLFQFEKTALGTAIAHSFPFYRREGFKWFFLPKFIFQAGIHGVESPSNSVNNSGLMKGIKASCTAWQ